MESFARAYGLAISKAQDKTTIKVLSELLMGESEELILHETYAKSWGIDLTTNIIEPTTKKYTDFLQEISQNYSCIEILSAMTPCMRLYAWIGKQILGQSSNNPYEEWILNYSDANFEKLAVSLENLINTYQNAYDFNHLNSFYRKAMQLEAEFFESYSNF